MDAKLLKIYSASITWKGLAAVKKLAAAAKVAEETVKNGNIYIYISQHHATFLGQSLMSSHPMQCIKQTFFCLTINSRMGERFTNTL